MQRRTYLTLAAGLSGSALLPDQADAGAAEMAFARVTTPNEFDAAVARARGQHKPILVYVTAGWCPVCASVDRQVFGNPVIMIRLYPIALIRADVTMVSDGNRALMQRLQVAGPPTMFFMGPKGGGEIPRTRLTGSVNANLFLDTLNLAGF